jgi:hypothetical protein
MIKVQVITGYVPLPMPHRSHAEYIELGHRLANVQVAPIHAYYGLVRDCWLDTWLGDRQPLVSRGDWPEKNTRDYHIVQHQKTQWLVWASRDFPDADTYVWVDFGILHMPGVTVTVIDEFLKRVRLDDFAIPGCSPLVDNIDDAVYWRFLGSVAIVPRRWVQDFDAHVKLVTKQKVRDQNRLTWEVNDWADVDRSGRLPIRWYEADHNVTQFTNYV